jgi:hypothetical protein
MDHTDWWTRVTLQKDGQGLALNQLISLTVGLSCVVCDKHLQSAIGGKRSHISQCFLDLTNIDDAMVLPEDRPEEGDHPTTTPGRSWIEHHRTKFATIAQTQCRIQL